MVFFYKYMSVRVGLQPLCKPYRELHYEKSLLDKLLRYRFEALEVTKSLNYFSDECC